MNEHEKLLEMSKPLIDYLKENYHPHTAIVVTEERVMVVETSVSVPSVDPVSGSDQQTKMDGKNPMKLSVEENDGDVEEERRLFYVAITRARDKLFISACRKRRHMQMTVETEPSRFLDEIPANLVEYHEPKQLTEEETGQMFSDFLQTLKAKSQ